MRVFLDTNVLVSAFATRGLAADLFRYLLAEHELIIGEVVLVELRRVLTRRLKVPNATIDAIELILREQEVVPKPKALKKLGIRDPDDEWIMASAMAGRADVLITGDQDLLSMADKAPIPVMTPRELWEALRAGNLPGN